MGAAAVAVGCCCRACCCSTALESTRCGAGVLCFGPPRWAGCLRCRAFGAHGARAACLPVLLRAAGAGWGAGQEAAGGREGERSHAVGAPGLHGRGPACSCSGHAACPLPPAARPIAGPQASGRVENLVGWYHSHPGYGCWLSGIDVGTQMTNQKYQARANLMLGLCRLLGGWFVSVRRAVGYCFQACPAIRIALLAHPAKPPGLAARPASRPPQPRRSGIPHPPQEPFLAIVVDPHRTVAAGKVEIGAFRTYPEASAAGQPGVAVRPQLSSG